MGQADAGHGPSEARACTPLELFFDLCFVVAVSQAAARLHQALIEGHVGAGLLGYLMVFFAIWWALVNFSAFCLYRITTMVRIAGALVLASGVPPALDRLAGFAVLVLAELTVPLWAERAAHGSLRRILRRPSRRPLRRGSLSGGMDVRAVGGMPSPWPSTAEASTCPFVSPFCSRRRRG